MTTIKQKILLTITILLIIVLIVFNALRSNTSHSIQQTYFYLGTVINITLFDTEDTTHLNNISKIVNDLENTLSRNIETSEISNINRLSKNTPLKITDDSYILIEKSIEYSELSQGYFDITVNPLVDLWSIGTEDQSVPDINDIEQALSYIDYNNIKLNKEDSSITLLSDDTTLDLGGIGKGYVADKIVEYLRLSSIDNALINLGGNVFALGSSGKNEPWNIGIQHPDFDKSGAIISIQAKDKSIVTSGIYERYFEEDGKLYHHILDPFTGYPIQNNILSLTIVSDFSIDGDALSTSMFALGKDKALEIISTLDNVEAIIVTNDNNIYLTKGIKDSYSLFDKKYTVNIYD